MRGFRGCALMSRAPSAKKPKAQWPPVFCEPCKSYVCDHVNMGVPDGPARKAGNGFKDIGNGTSVGYGDSRSDKRTADARAQWEVLKSTHADSASRRYIEHEEALREFENQKLSRLQVMEWAQRTRTKFLKLSMEERRLFLNVLASNEGGSFSKMLALQEELEAEGITDAKLKLTKKATKLLEPGKKKKHVNDLLPTLRGEIHTQEKKAMRRTKLLAADSSDSHAALPSGTFGLPGSKPQELRSREEKADA